MNQLITKGYLRATIGAAIVVAACLAIAAPAFAVDPTPSDVITTATSSMSTQLLAVIAVVLGIAVTFLVIRIGWRWVRSFVK